MASLAAALDVHREGLTALLRQRIEASGKAGPMQRYAVALLTDPGVVDAIMIEAAAELAREYGYG